MVLGKAKFINFSKFKEWLDTPEAESFYSIQNLWTDRLYKLQGEIDGVEVGKLSVSKKKDNFSYYFYEPLCEYAEYMKAINEQNSLDDIEYIFDLYYIGDIFYIIGFSDKRFVVPKDAVDVKININYDKMSFGELTAIASGNDSDVGASSGETALATMSKEYIKNSLDVNAQSGAALAEKMEDVKSAKVGELAVLQAEIEKKVAELEALKNDMMLELQKQQEAMKAEKAKLEQKLFMLETQIYSIRCYTGEVVDFVKLRSGEEASVQMPITLFQKVRYMDEELGKLASVYNADFEDAKYFEKYIAQNDMAFETFCPNDKCVCLVCVSRSKLGYSFYDTPFGVLLEKYKKYHGSKVAILIRNGENLYLAWTDDDKIKVNDDFFYTPQTKKVEEGDKVQSSTPTEIASRYFLFSVLQGVLDNSKFVTFPEKTDITKQSRYVVFSSADGWITDNRFGSFDDILKKTQKEHKVGNYIILWDTMRDGHYNAYQRTLEYERDRNDSHRTSDVSAGSGEIHRLNLVESYTVLGNSVGLAYYISLRKDCSDYDIYRSMYNYHERKREARANFRVYENEFIDLTYLNTVYINYVITTRNIGLRNRKGDFAYAIRFLHKMAKFLSERESKERELIIKYLPNLDEIGEWQILLSDWKMAKSVTEITDWQAKRFAKYIKEGRC